VDLPANVLLPGEQLLWPGRPQRFAPGRLGFFPVVWAVGGLLIAWVPVALRQRALRRAAYLGALPPPVTRAGADGVGAVSFGGSGGFPDAMISAANTRSAAVEFVAVPDVERVRDLIAQAQTRPPVAG
jgi:hypothetical protein